jgi:SHS2 domain-containing protein
MKSGIHGASHVASHVLEEHTSEVQIRLQAPDLGALFAEAGRALMELMSGGAVPAPSDAPDAPETLTLHSSDRDALLVDWLNELIYRVETEKKIYGEIAVQTVDGRALSATIRGAPAEGLRTLVKAASFHGLKIVEDEGGHAATVVLDV